jgi:hypothetical protein
VGQLTLEIEVLGENLHLPHFIHYKYHITLHGIEPGLPQWDAGDTSPERWL